MARGVRDGEKLEGVSVMDKEYKKIEFWGHIVEDKEICPILGLRKQLTDDLFVDGKEQI